MNTVREDLRIPGTDQVGHDILERAECLAWRKFEQLRRDGKLKLWGVLDASGVVELAMLRIMGPRPAGCGG